MINIVLGTFFGDEAKGQCVNNLATEESIVVRFSGANQVGHNVQHNGLKHCFRNFGSGTLKGATTYWSKYCVCDLHTVLLEYAELKSQGIVPKIIFSPECELVTPFDVISQWNNSSNREHGTVGTGFKPTLDRVKNGYHLTIVDALNYQVLKEKVYNIGRYYYNFTSDCPVVKLDEWLDGIYKMANLFPIQDERIIKSYKDVIFEGSQGILLDQKHGVMPFCTPSYTTSKNALEIIDSLNIIDDIVINYVCRPYITRHGNGPLLTSTPIIDVNDSNNQWNDFQKSFRACKFDIDLLIHSLRIDKIYSESCYHRIVFSHANELSKDLIKDVVDKTGYDVTMFEFENWL